MIIKIIAVCLIAASIILMALPLGVPIRYVYSVYPTIEIRTHYFSYFSLFPLFGGANIFPMMTALFSVVAFLRIIVSLIKYKNDNSDNQEIFDKPTLIFLLISMTSPFSLLIFRGAFKISIISVVCLAFMQ